MCLTSLLVKGHSFFGVVSFPYFWEELGCDFVLMLWFSLFVSVSNLLSLRIVYPPLDCLFPFFLKYIIFSVKKKKEIIEDAKTEQIIEWLLKHTDNVIDPYN